MISTIQKFNLPNNEYTRQGASIVHKSQSEEKIISNRPRNPPPPPPLLFWKTGSSTEYCVSFILQILCLDQTYSEYASFVIRDQTEFC